MKNYYAVLQVRNFETPDAIKAAYRALSKKYHPDLNKTAGSEKMAEINCAYDILKDPVKKAAFDRELRARLAQEKEASQQAARWAAEQEAIKRDIEQELAKQAVLRKRTVISSIRALLKSLVIASLTNMVLSNWLYLDAPRSVLVYIMFGVSIGLVIKKNGGDSSIAVAFAGALVCLLALLIPHIYLASYEGTFLQIFVRVIQEALGYLLCHGRFRAISVILAPMATFFVTQAEMA